MFPGFFLIKKVPKFFMLISITISCFLLAFLLLGCTKTASSYSNVYLVKYQFNQTSPMYSKIKTAYAEENLSDLADISIKVAYLGICVDANSNLTCSSTSDLTPFEQFSGISVISSSSGSNDSSTDLDLVTLSSIFANKICHPYILMATGVITILLFFIILWSSIPFIPGKEFAKKISVIFACADVLLWGLGSMLAHEASKAGKDLVEPSSLYMVEATVGGRAEAMTWTAFTFILAVAMGSVILYIQDLKRKVEDIEPKV